MRRPPRPWGRAIALSPDYAEPHANLGTVLLKMGKPTEAIERCRRASDLDPRNPDAHCTAALAWLALDEPAEAKLALEQALRIQPASLQAKYVLALLLATGQDDSLRDGKLAVHLAQELCQATNYLAPAYLETLAAAYAEDGQFDEAIAIAARAVDLLKDDPAAGEQAGRLRRQLRGYRAGQPLRVSTSGNW